MDPLVLIADGSISRSQHLANFFFRAGFNVERVVNGAECVARLREAEPEVLFVDLDVPLTDDELPGAGECLLSYLRDRTEIKLPIFVLVSGAASPLELSIRARVPPAFCFTRPIQHEQLVKCLTESGKASRSQQPESLN